MVLVHPTTSNPGGDMKLSVEFPSVAYREGPEGVTRLAKAIEDIGFDQLDMFDHVISIFAVKFFLRISIRHFPL